MNIECRKHIYPVILIAAILLGIGSCANEAMPTGGQRDSEPPSAVKSKPSNGSVRFVDKQIKITFDEYISAPINTSEIWITPEMDNKPDFWAVGKTLTIKIKDTLKANTTYNIGFGKAIQDVTEKNILTNFSYTFTTGDSLDIGLLSGMTINNSDLKPIGGISIGLYKDSLFDKKPLYYTKSDDNGNWQLNNLKEGEYWLFAFEDKNGSKIYDYGDGVIGFESKKVQLKDTIGMLSIFLFLENDEIQLKEIVPRENNTAFVFSRPIKKLELSTEPKNIAEYAVLNNSKDTLFFWYKNTNDSVEFYLNIDDTTIVRNTKTNNAKDTITISYRNKQTVSPILDFTCKTNNPIGKIFEHRIRILEDSINNIDKKTTLFSKADNQFSAKFTKAENARYYVVFEDSALLDIFGNFNEKTIVEFKTGRETDYGNLIIKNNGNDYLIIEVIDNKNNVIAKAYLGGSVNIYKFMQLEKGNYSILGVVDENQNGFWDVGSFKQRTQAEMKLPLKDLVEIKGGWDVEADIVIEKDENGAIKRTKRDKAPMGK